MPDAPATPDRSTCEVHSWPVFVHGFFKGDLYPRAEIERLVANFAALSDPAAATFRRDDGSPYLIARVKLGHDQGQRLKQSLGFLNVGRVVRVAVGDKGKVNLWLTNVPATVGAAMNAGWITEGSIDVKPDLPNPTDASRKIPGPILEAVSLLGEEQPAVKGLDLPVAVFADGTPVPPMTDPSEWLLAMFETLKGVQGDAAPPVTGNAAGTMSLAFSSEYDPKPTPDSIPPKAPNMDPKIQQLTALGLTPEQAAQAVEICGQQMADGPGAATVPPAKPAAPAPVAMSDEDKEKQFAAACKKAFADDPETEEQFSTMFSEFSDLKKRFSDMEAAKVADQKKDGEAMSAAFSAEWDAKFAAGDGARKLTPQEAKALKDKDADLSKTAAFSAADARAGILSGLSARLAALPVNPMIQPAGAPAGTIPVQLTGDGRKLLNTIKVTNPRVHDRLTNATA